MTALFGGLRTPVRLLCLHYAGGSEAAFRSWHTDVPAGVELTSVTLPSTHPVGGRRVHLDAESVVDYLNSEYAAELDDEHVLVGHSMGGLLAYLLARRRIEAGQRPPAGIAIMASVAPHRTWQRLPDIDSLDDEQFAALLARFGGVPDMLLRRPQWLRPLLPVIRDDLRICQNYRHRPQAGDLPVPMHVIGGLRDTLVVPEAINAWRELHSEASIEFLDSGHFFGDEWATELRARVFDFADRVLRAPAVPA